MKYSGKWIRVFLVFLTLCMLSSAGAALELDLQSQKLSGLYTIYRQIEAQQQLNDLSNRAAYESVADYELLERNPNDYKGDKIKFSGTVLQVTEGKSKTTYRVAKDGKSSQVFYVSYARPQEAMRILEDDEVEVYAEFTGLKTYTSTTNRSVSVPGCEAALIIRPVVRAAIQNASRQELEEAKQETWAQIIEKSPKDDEGRYLINKNTFDGYARSEASHAGEPVSLKGRVLQVTEGDYGNRARIAVDDESDMVAYVRYTPDEDGIRVLEDDFVEVVGTYTGLYTYSSTLGGEITIPSCSATEVTPVYYTAPKSFERDAKGNTLITKNTFEDFSRRPGAHEDEAVKFKGKVLQVIEGTDHSEYRIAVNDNYDHVIYVLLDAADKTTRVLKDDQVTVYGRYTGTITYESTQGVSITIPSCRANLMEVEGYTASNVKKNEADAFMVNKANYGNFARDEATYAGETISFSAKVIQVIEGKTYSQYRMAIDGDLDCMFFTQINSDKMTIRLLEDDEITATGTYHGLYTYESTRGGSITIPSCVIESYEVKGYEAAKTVTDAEGYCWITKDNYEEYARNANAHFLERIRFAGRVVQVVERSGGENIYRVAVDSDPGCMFYVEYTLPKGGSRILEDDIVQLDGTYYGLYTYSTTMGSEVTVPAAIVDSVRPSYKPLKQGNSGKDVLAMKLRLQKLGYFRASATLSEGYNETCASRVKDFQKANGLPETGEADAVTLTVLYSEQAVCNPNPL